ncbi:MAG: D-Ala-D-Ala carboxypeptidase family metallohydrolase [Minicystis sp.]
MRAFPSAWTALAAGLVAFAAAPSAPAALLDEPPKLYTFKLDDPSIHGAPRLPLLDPFRDAAVDPSSGLRRYLSGTFGRWRAEPWWPLSWQSTPVAEGNEGAPSRSLEPQIVFDEGEGDAPLFGFAPSAPRALSLAPEAAPLWLTRLDPAAFAPLVPTTGPTFKSNGFDALWSLPPKKPIPDWRCRRRPVRIARYGGESDMFALVRCNGAVATEAYDRLTILARETSAPRPGELLPDDPDPEAVARAEWTPGVRLVHPRLLWALQRIADAFPWRTVYIYSGYRHDPSFRTAKPGSHHSMHSEARALDITVMGIPNAALFQVCRKLEDVGCGFYPNNRFVHVDVRRPGSGHPMWIDVSAPGEPSRYVDAWPGVVEGGALVWDASARRGEPAHSSAEASCTRRGTSP